MRCIRVEVFFRNTHPRQILAGGAVGMMALDGDKWSVVMLSPSTANGRMPFRRVLAAIHLPSMAAGEYRLLCARQSYSGLVLLLRPRSVFSNIGIINFAELLGLDALFDDLVNFFIAGQMSFRVTGLPSL